MNAVIETLTDSLWAISWKLVGVTFIAGALALAYKIIEKKLLDFIGKKAKERKEKKLEELAANKKTRVEHDGPTYEEWKAAK